MRKKYLFLSLIMLASVSLHGQESDPLATGLGGVATVAGETQTAAESEKLKVESKGDSIPMWKKKLYYGYNFDRERLVIRPHPGDRMETDGEDLLGYAVRR